MIPALLAATGRTPRRGVADRLFNFTYKTSAGGSTVFSSGSSGTVTSTNVTDEAVNHPGANIISLYLKWKDYEQTDGGFDAMIEAALDFTLLDGHRKGYSLIFRFACGSESPAYLWSTAQSTLTFNEDPPNAGIPSTHTPWPTDAVYVAKQTRVMTRWAAWMKDTCPGGGHPRSAHIVMVPACRATGTGPELDITESKLSTAYSGGTQTTSAAIRRTDTAITLTSTGAALDTAGWPTGNHIVRLGGLGGVDWTTYGIKRVLDTFQKTAAASSLGLTKQGLPFTLAGTASQYAATGTAGTLSLTAGGQSLFGTVSDQPGAAGSYASIDVLGRVAWANAPTATATHGPALLACYADVNNYYRLQLRHASGGTLALRLQKRVASTTTQIGTDVSLGSYTLNSQWYLRLQVSGGTIKAKAWLASSAEPDWQITQADSALTAGSVGIGAYSDAADATNPVFSWNWLVAADVTGAELVWASRTAGSNTLNVQTGGTMPGRGWPGSGARDWASGTTAEYCTETAWTSNSLHGRVVGATFDEWVGDFDAYAANWEGWQAVSDQKTAVGTRPVRRTVWQAAWLADVAAMQDTFPDAVRIGYAAGGLWGDTTDGAVSPKLMTAIVNTLSGQTITGSTRNRVGSRLVVMMTNWSSGWAGSNGSINTCMNNAITKRSAIAGQTKGNGFFTTVQPVVDAGEEFLTTYGDRPVFYETLTEAFANTGSVTTSATGGWPGGATAGMRGYLVNDASNMQKRL